jgi:hypothetical protein
MFAWERYKNDRTQYTYEANHEPSYPVTCMPIARQRLGKHIPATHENTIGHLLLGNGQVNTPP